MRGKAATSKTAARPKKRRAQGRALVVALVAAAASRDRARRGLRRDLLPGGEGAVPGDARAGAACAPSSKGCARATTGSRAQVDRLKTPEGVEDYARVQLGLVKAGEKVGVVVDESASTPTTITVASSLRLDSEEAVVPPVGPWTAFLDSVFGIE